MSSADDLEWYTRPHLRSPWQSSSAALNQLLPVMSPQLQMVNRSVPQLSDLNAYKANSDAESAFLNPSNYCAADQLPNYFDVLLASKFNQLNLNSAAPIPPPVNNAGGSWFGSINPSGNMNNYPFANHNLFRDPQRMTVDSAIRGQQIRGFRGGYDYDSALGGGYGGGRYAGNGGELNNLLYRRQQQLNPDLNDLLFNRNFNERNHEPGFDHRRRPRRHSHGLHSSSGSASSLEQLRSKIFSSLEELRGKIYVVAKDQNGCRDLQKILVEGKAEEKELIFSELKNHIRDLMVDQFANYLVQKLFEECNEEQITDLLVSVIGDEHHLLAICLDMHGTRAMQKLLGLLTTSNQRSLVISALQRITVTLSKSTNGHHVIEHCLKHFPHEDKTCILNVVADNCLDIATDKSGCCVLQQCFEQTCGKPPDRLVSEIISNSLVLSEHPYGNYVVQFLVGLRKPDITHDILSHLAGNYASLSMNKYGSNVVEKCMKELSETSSEGELMHIIKEIISSPNFVTVVQDPFGNYVAQSAFSLAKGYVRHAMINLIEANYSYLHSHPHGKRVLARVKGSRHRV